MLNGLNLKKYSIIILLVSILILSHSISSFATGSFWLNLPKDLSGISEGEIENISIFNFREAITEYFIDQLCEDLFEAYDAYFNCMNQGGNCIAILNDIQEILDQLTQLYGFNVGNGFVCYEWL